MILGSIFTHKRILLNHLCSLTPNEHFDIVKDFLYVKKLYGRNSSQNLQQVKMSVNFTQFYKWSYWQQSNKVKQKVTLPVSFGYLQQISTRLNLSIRNEISHEIRIHGEKEENFHYASQNPQFILINFITESCQPHV